MIPRRLLYLAHRVPYPMDKGDRIRTFHAIEYLARQGHDIHLAALADEPVHHDHVLCLEQLCEEVGIVPLGRGRWLNAMAAAVRGRTITEGAFCSRRMRMVLRTWTADARFDAIIASGSGLYSYVNLPYLRQTPLFVDLIDVDSQKWFDYAAQTAGPRRLLYQMEGQRLRALERRIAERALGVVMVSTAEAKLLDAGRVHVIPNGVDLDYFQSSGLGDEQTCVFVGALNYLPNVDGIVWFCQEVWPTVTGHRPDARMYVVGRRPVSAVNNLGQLPGVTVVGEVDDVRPYLERAAVVVVPLRIARGVQNKVLEAFAMARTVVASPGAMAALETTDGQEVVVARDRDQWVKHLGDLLADAPRRRTIGAAARRYVESRHRWSDCLRPWDDLLNTLPVTGEPMPR